ncbi:uncharacterized protein B0H18DRAFT_822588, partial [Fomitopsis serialis]|uniref:uncharacterized protein n=1 Tax=Fomitopsis serialis TaxID=139415 RepID=UPI0020078333
PIPIGPSPERSHSHSPVRLRRSNSDIADVDPTVPHSRPRLSPTLTRGYNPNDPEVRERQRAMDADMAMHLSRARSNTVTSPTTSPVAPVPRPLSQSLDSPVNFPVLSLQEEQDVNDARGRPHVNSDPDHAEHYHPGPAPDAHLNHLSAAHDPSLLVSMETADMEAGLPMYQASV